MIPIPIQPIQQQRDSDNKREKQEIKIEDNFCPECGKPWIDCKCTDEVEQFLES